MVVLAPESQEEGHDAFQPEVDLPLFDGWRHRQRTRNAPFILVRAVVAQFAAAANALASSSVILPVPLHTTHTG